MKVVKKWWQKMLGMMILGLFIAIAISACYGVSATPQNCDGVVNVNSCTSSSNVGIQTTAEAQQYVANMQATTQVNLDATATAAIAIQKTASKDEGIVSIGKIVIPIVLVISFIAFLASFALDEDGTFVKVALGIVTFLLIVMVVIIIRGV